MQTQHFSMPNLPSVSPFPVRLSVVPNSSPDLVLQGPSLICEAFEQDENSPNMSRMGEKDAFYVAIVRRSSELIT